MEGFVAITLGAVIASILNDLFGPDAPMLSEGVSPFAAIYVAAQALERLLEPFASRYRGEDKAEAKAKLVTATVANDVQTQATESRALAVIRADRAIFVWALATVLAMSVSASTGLYLLHLIGASNSPIWLDIVVTGLAIGGGTKPLHDLISKIEKSKEKS